MCRSRVLGVGRRKYYIGIGRSRVLSIGRSRILGIGR